MASTPVTGMVSASYVATASLPHCSVSSRVEGLGVSNMAVGARVGVRVGNMVPEAGILVLWWGGGVSGVGLGVWQYEASAL